MLNIKLSRKSVGSPTGPFDVSCLEIKYQAAGWEKPITAEINTDCRFLDLAKFGGAALSEAGPFVECMAEEIKVAKSLDEANKFVRYWNLVSPRKLDALTAETVDENCFDGIEGE